MAGPFSAWWQNAWNGDAWVDGAWYEAEFPDARLRHHWKFNNDTTYEEGLYDIVEGGVTYVQGIDRKDEVANGAIDFVNITDALEVVDSPILPWVPERRSLSISCWISTLYSGGRHTIYSETYDSNAFWELYMNSQGEVCYEFQGTSGNYQYESSAFKLNDGKEHLIIFTDDGAGEGVEHQLGLCVDNRDDPNIGPYTPDYSSGTWDHAWIAASNINPSEDAPFIGVIDDFRIWSGVMSPDQKRERWEERIRFEGHRGPYGHSSDGMGIGGLGPIGW